MKYGLDANPGMPGLLLYGLQWWVVSLPSIIIMGLVVSRLQFSTVIEQAWYMQKLFGVMGVATAVQALAGHRLPLVVGPASALLVGIVASSGVGPDAMYTAILIGGIVVGLLAFSGLLSRLRAVFTPRIVAVTLVLIAFTLAPTILRLVFGNGERPVFHLVFGLGMVFGLVFCNLILPGVFRSLTVIVGVVGGSACYFGFTGLPELPGMDSGGASLSLFPGFELHAGTIVSFLFCFLALSINELGSIESVGQMLKAEDMPGRVRRGVGLQGLANVLSGGLGIIGPVDYSMSAGVIAATGCASRLPLVPAGIGLFACAFFPHFVMLLALIPGPVMGALMLYLMASQLASGLSMLVGTRSITRFESGLCVGLPLMVGLMVAFMPAGVLSAFPDLLRPIVGNGFVMGILTVIFLEHGVFAKALRQDGGQASD